jgi:hypothetical protein
MKVSVTLTSFQMILYSGGQNERQWLVVLLANRRDALRSQDVMESVALPSCRYQLLDCMIDMSLLEFSI